ncbi:hypothetical protein [Sinorhizobium terangae]|uniref:DUF680 domain-containing protein n=1 Tax=Sinorhizobium terangae TaxID=110322 RepID=A0A6N7LIL0_SINTE|nr:hypothetical protein [Sinorhizobium terangae]MBB4185134.1 hypothetical protein [Sinorhizobium terangae]MQX17617.1 hypothetical protein [Sinorhizobium terangae]WFU48583.1 hypothetical protein QA637_03935 [Sinorhizobium terangae]
MNKSIAALLVAVAVTGVASTASAGGSYYKGVSSTPLFTGRAAASAGTGVSASTADNGEFYAGVDNKSVDAASTGAIVNGRAAVNVPAADEQNAR